MTIRMNSAPIALAVLASGMAFALPAFAQDSAPMGADDTASAHNILYEQKLAISLTTPVTVGEMLHCSAVWDRWAYVVESAADPAFKKGLRAELSVKNAKSRQRHWERMARREVRSDDDEDYFDGSRDIAERRADKLSAEYASGTESGMTSMMGWLASCR